MIGEPVTSAGCHLMPANLSAPLDASWPDTCSWSAARTLTQKRPVRWTIGQARDERAGTNSTRGGSSETLEKDWQVMPIGSPLLTVVITVMPEAKVPSTSRNR